MSAADTMRKLIEQAGLSQREAANEIGVTQRTFRDWCAGKSEPPRAVLMALELLAVKARGKAMAGRRKAEDRTDGDYVVYRVIQDYLDGTEGILGYTIDGPGADSSFMLAADQVEAKLRELKAKQGR